VKGGATGSAGSQRGRGYFRLEHSLSRVSRMPTDRRGGKFNNVLQLPVHSVRGTRINLSMRPKRADSVGLTVSLLIR